VGKMVISGRFMVKKPLFGSSNTVPKVIYPIIS
jgi:hypothetical protein